MDLSTALMLMGLMAVSCGIAVMSLRAFAFLDDNQVPDGFMGYSGQAINFLFEDEMLVDATDSAHELLQETPSGTSDLERIKSFFATRFPDIATALEELPETVFKKISSAEGNGVLTLEWLNGMSRLSFLGLSDETDYLRIDKHCYDAMEQEIQTLRKTADVAPFLVWREQKDGSVSWANNAYISIAQQFQADSSVKPWPLCRVFPKRVFECGDNANKTLRLSTQLPKEAEPRWFDCTQTQLGDDFLYTGIAVDKTVKAEAALRDFTQTLTKTFAHLKIGLAIFDKQRQLAVFNPALTDLTSIPVDFLLQRPTLYTVLNRLREKRMLPEQRDYISWRQRLFELETAAQNGTFEEIWSLATGQTYRVTGHPHPDGALAFLMEDISVEISLSRRFRRELGTGQAVIDSLSEAIAVFSSDGNLILTNAAYSQLWGAKDCNTIAGTGIAEATRTWGAKCPPTPVWGDAREYIGLLGERFEWNAEVRLADGRLLICRFSPLADGSTLVGFSPCLPTKQRIDENVFAPSLTLNKMPG